MSYYKTLKITNEGDLDTSGNTFTIIKNTSDELLQYVVSILNIRKGEWFLNTETGLSHENIFVKGNINVDLIRLDIVETLRQDSRIKTIDNIQIIQNENRAITITFIVTTTEDNALNVEVVL